MELRQLVIYISNKPTSESAQAVQQKSDKLTATSTCGSCDIQNFNDQQCTQK